MKCPFVIKVCSKCGELLVAYSGNFNKQKSGKWGLRSSCKRCQAEYNTQWRENNKEYYAQYYEDNKERIAQYREDNKERIAQHNAQYYENNKERIAEYKAQYYENNKERIAQHNAQWRENNKERIAQYREDNKERLAEYSAQYYKDNPDKIFNKNNKRRQLEENQGDGITKEQWLEMMSFFKFKCAYSGEYIGGDSKDRTVDHIIPLNKGGLNEVWNCVPMLKSYNSSKHTNDMEEWYKQQEFYSEERLIKIYEWIEYAYEKWGNLEE